MTPFFAPLSCCASGKAGKPRQCIKKFIQLVISLPAGGFCDKHIWAGIRCPGISVTSKNAWCPGISCWAKPIITLPQSMFG